MNKNFVFSDFVSITVQGETLDLHNDYDLSEITIDNLNHKCSILWRSNQFCRLDISEIRIVFTGVSKLIYNMLFDKEGISLKFAGYLPIEDFGPSSHFMAEEDSNENDHIILTFENDSSISILADSATATVVRV